MYKQTPNSNAKTLDGCKIGFGINEQIEYLNLKKKETISNIGFQIDELTFNSMARLIETITSYVLSKNLVIPLYLLSK